MYILLKDIKISENDFKVLLDKVKLLMSEHCESYTVNHCGKIKCGCTILIKK